MRRELLSAVVVLGTIMVSFLAIEVLLRLASAVDLIKLQPDFDVLSQYRTDWHHDRPPLMPPQDDWRKPAFCSDPSLTVVIAGDSWMREPEFGRALLDRLAEGESSASWKKCIRIVNTGTGSYSPSPMTVRLAYLFSDVKADIVVINIDETDLMDEWIRYRHATIVSSDGVPIAVVPYIADLPDMLHFLSMEVLQRVPLYTLRLAERAFLQVIFIPQVREALRARGQLAVYDTILAPQLSREPEQMFGEAIKLFQKRLRALVQVIRRYNPRAEVVVTHHPHYRHLVDGEQRYTFSVEDVLRDVFSDGMVRLFVARDEMEKVHGKGYSLEDVFEWPRDPFSHLTPRGRRNYGHWVGAKIAAFLNGETRETDLSR